ncbi:MAG: DUF5758 domain-containing protein [Clostridia bacterium]
MSDVRKRVTVAELLQRYEAGERIFQNLHIVGNSGGKTAWLKQATFIHCKFSRAKLPGALLSDTTLTGVNFYQCDLRGVYWVDSRWNAVGLNSCNLGEADLCNVFMRSTVIKGGSLTYASALDADMRGTRFSPREYLHFDVCHALFTGAILPDDFDVSKLVTNCLTLGLAPAPEGELVMWGWKSGHLVEMLVPREAKRSWATTPKLRAEYVVTLSIDDDDVPGVYLQCHHDRFGDTRYTVGEITRCHEWDSCRWHECSGGIHGFLWREDAVAWGQKGF